jgi:hypothetical protein
MLSFHLKSQTVQCEKGTGSQYFFKCKNVYFEIDTAKGARVTSLKIDGSEILNQSFTSTSDGSTFWPSPQTAWDWPPIPEIDNMPYTVQKKDSTLVLIGKTAAEYKLSVDKVFSADERDTSITLKYLLKNKSNATVQHGPWEVTRVPAQGLTFFSKGINTVSGNMASNVEEAIGTYWYNQNTTTSSSSKAKFFSDGKGWLAHVNNNRQILIKKFTDIAPSQFAPAHSEVEIYTAADHSYTELENLGAYSSIKAGEDVEWQVKWFLRNLPSDITVAKGNQKLIDYVNGVIAGPPVSVTSKTTFNKIVNMTCFPVRGLLHFSIPFSLKRPLVLSIYTLQGKRIYGCQLKCDGFVNISRIAKGNFVYTLDMSGDVVQKGKLSIVL